MGYAKLMDEGEFFAETYRPLDDAPDTDVHVENLPKTGGGQGSEESSVASGNTVLRENRTRK